MREKYRVLTDEQFATLIESDMDEGDELHKHFEAFGGSDWIDVAEEGRRVLNIAAGMAVEEHSLIDAVIHAVAAQAAHTAFTSVAKVLGVDLCALECAVACWCEEPVYRTDAPVAPQVFMQQIAECALALENSHVPD